MTFDAGARTIKYRQLATSAPVSVDTGDEAGTEVTLGDLIDERVDVNDGGKETVNTVIASGPALTIDLADGNIADVTLTADCTLTLTGATAGKGCWLTLVLRQDGTGSRTVTWPGSVEWPAANVPTLETTANELDVIALFTLDGGTAWFAFHFSGGSIVVAFGDLSDVTLSSSTAGQVPVFDGAVWRNRAIPAEHVHITDEQFSGDGATTTFTLANEAVPESAIAYVGGTRTSVSVGGSMNDQLTFAAAPASGTNNISVDYVAVAS